MNHAVRLARLLVPEEIRALLEKIDGICSVTDSSYYVIKDFLRSARLNRLERWLVRNAMNSLARRETLHDAMHIVIYNQTPKLSVSRVDENLPIAGGNFIRNDFAKVVVKRKPAAVS